ncbi:MAG TPA: UbiD family decarboxylase [Chloroflexota bacterium]|nr:UbiD family decarboxylase [Chloroflexota bacterium]
MTGTVFNGLQEYVDAAMEVDEYRVIEGADWDGEIGALIEVVAETIDRPPMLIFDRIKGYPAGYRLVALHSASAKRMALALGLPTDKSRDELNQLGRQKLRSVKPIPPVQVATGPVMENAITGDDVDIFKFPVPRYHAMDGGRYVGTGDSLVNRDPESGYVNVGTYRMQAHDRNLLGLWMSPGQQGRLICQRYWDRGEACPVVATFGADPLYFMGAHSRQPWGSSELDYIGGLRGSPIEVIPGPLTGLPIPAHAEIAIEGEVPPPAIEARDEGPFGEWPGYYSGGSLGTGEPQPVIRIKAIYHRTNPMILSQAPLWPGARVMGLDFGDGRGGIRDLQAAGISDVVAVGHHMGYIRAISIRQRYPGHAAQAAHAAVASTRNGRWIVIVDEDIDPTDFKEVMWAMTTRCEPATDIEIVRGTWSTPLDPLVSSDPQRRESGDHTNSLAIFYACRPFHRKDAFPKVSRAPRELRQQVMEKYRPMFAFPS